MPLTILDPLDAQIMQDTDPTLVWVVTDQHPAHPGSFLAGPHTIDKAGGQALEMALVASSFEQLHGLLPKGLVRDERASFWPPEVLEMWSAG